MRRFDTWLGTNFFDKIKDLMKQYAILKKHQVQLLFQWGPDFAGFPVLDLYVARNKKTGVVAVSNNFLAHGTSGICLRVCVLKSSATHRVGGDDPGGGGGERREYPDNCATH